MHWPRGGLHASPLDHAADRAHFGDQDRAHEGSCAHTWHTAGVPIADPIDPELVLLHPNSAAAAAAAAVTADVVAARTSASDTCNHTNFARQRMRSRLFV